CLLPNPSSEQASDSKPHQDKLETCSLTVPAVPCEKKELCDFQGTTATAHPAKSPTVPPNPYRRVGPPHARPPAGAPPASPAQKFLPTGVPAIWPPPPPAGACLLPNPSSEPASDSKPHQDKLETCSFTVPAVPCEEKKELCDFQGTTATAHPAKSPTVPPNPYRRVGPPHARPPAGAPPASPAQKFLPTGVPAIWPPPPPAGACLLPNPSSEPASDSKPHQDKLETCSFTVPAVPCEEKKELCDFQGTTATAHPAKSPTVPPNPYRRVGPPHARPPAGAPPASPAQKFLPTGVPAIWPPPPPAGACLLPNPSSEPASDSKPHQDKLETCSFTVPAVPCEEKKELCDFQGTTATAHPAKSPTVPPNPYRRVGPPHARPPAGAPPASPAHKFLPTGVPAIWPPPPPAGACLLPNPSSEPASDSKPHQDKLETCSFTVPAVPCEEKKELCDFQGTTATAHPAKSPTVPPNPYRRVGPPHARPPAGAPPASPAQKFLPTGVPAIWPPPPPAGACLLPNPSSEPASDSKPHQDKLETCSFTVPAVPCEEKKELCDFQGTTATAHPAKSPTVPPNPYRRVGPPHARPPAGAPPASPAHKFLPTGVPAIWPPPPPAGACLLPNPSSEPASDSKPHQDKLETCSFTVPAVPCEEKKELCDFQGTTATAHPAKSPTVPPNPYRRVGPPHARPPAGAPPASPAQKFLPTGVPAIWPPPPPAGACLLPNPSSEPASDSKPHQDKLETCSFTVPAVPCEEKKELCDFQGTTATAHPAKSPTVPPNPYRRVGPPHARPPAGAPPASPAHKFLPTGVPAIWPPPPPAGACLLPNPSSEPASDSKPHQDKLETCSFTVPAVPCEEKKELCDFQGTTATAHPAKSPTVPPNPYRRVGPPHARPPAGAPPASPAQKFLPTGVPAIWPPPPPAGACLLPNPSSEPASDSKPHQDKLETCSFTVPAVPCEEKKELCDFQGTTATAHPAKSPTVPPNPYRRVGPPHARPPAGAPPASPAHKFLPTGVPAIWPPPPPAGACLLPNPSSEPASDSKPHQDKLETCSFTVPAVPCEEKKELCDFQGTTATAHPAKSPTVPPNPYRRVGPPHARPPAGAPPASPAHKFLPTGVPAIWPPPPPAGACLLPNPSSEPASDSKPHQDKLETCSFTVPAVPCEEKKELCDFQGTTATAHPAKSPTVPPNPYRRVGPPHARPPAGAPPASPAHKFLPTGVPAIWPPPPPAGACLLPNPSSEPASDSKPHQDKLETCSFTVPAVPCEEKKELCDFQGTTATAHPAKSPTVPPNPYRRVGPPHARPPAGAPPASPAQKFLPTGVPAIWPPPPPAGACLLPNPSSEPASDSKPNQDKLETCSFTVPAVPCEEKKELCDFQGTTATAHPAKSPTVPPNPYRRVGPPHARPPAGAPPASPAHKFLPTGVPAIWPPPPPAGACLLPNPSSEPASDSKPNQDKLETCSFTVPAVPCEEKKELCDFQGTTATAHPAKSPTVPPNPYRRVGPPHARPPAGAPPASPAQKFLPTGVPAIWPPPPPAGACLLPNPSSEPASDSKPHQDKLETCSFTVPAVPCEEKKELCDFQGTTATAHPAKSPTVPPNPYRRVGPPHARPPAGAPPASPAQKFLPTGVPAIWPPPPPAGACLLPNPSSEPASDSKPHQDKLETCSFTVPAVPCEEKKELCDFQGTTATAHPAKSPTVPPNPYRRVGPPHARPPAGAPPASPAQKFLPTGVPAIWPPPPPAGACLLPNPSSEPASDSKPHQDKLETCSFTVPAVPCEEKKELCDFQGTTATAHPAKSPTVPPNPYRRVGPPHARPPAGAPPASPAHKFLPTGVPAIWPPPPPAGACLLPNPSSEPASDSKPNQDKLETCSFTVPAVPCEEKKELCDFQGTTATAHPAKSPTVPPNPYRRVGPPHARPPAGAPPASPAHKFLPTGVPAIWPPPPPAGACLLPNPSSEPASDSKPHQDKLETCSFTVPAVPCEEKKELCDFQGTTATAHPAKSPTVPPNPYRRVGPPHARPPAGAPPASPAHKFLPTGVPAIWPPPPPAGGM
ncbi:nascent polypeptide-associated complex subunit alpha, muscle-specific form-like, partial [Ochotona curzoniae]|uniref:nascent polypeptide-associated complex subunit alpha, muscle-specific form-like n=1 Tax=Ochotona curzoniae TaxID=130825 RepID=UPI001B34FBE9